MIKRFYQSYNAVKYSFPLTALAFAIFAEAFLYTDSRSTKLRILMIITAVILAAVMVFYYRNKYRINKALKGIRNIDEYEEGGCVERSWFLEDRMLVSDGKKIAEHPAIHIDSAELKEMRHKLYLEIHQNGESYDLLLTDKESGERVTAYLLKRNPSLQFINIKPKGSGSLKELGADYGKNTG